MPGKCCAKRCKSVVRVVVDWRCDRIAPGIAERLVHGHQLQLAVNGTHCGENLPLYVRDQLAGNSSKMQPATGAPTQDSDTPSAEAHFFLAHGFVACVNVGA